MTLYDSALWLFLGLLAVGFIVVLLRLRKPKSKIKNPLFEGKQIQDWEKVFAWKPVRLIEGDWLWLRYYWRRKVYSPATEDGEFEDSWYYQNVTNVRWYLW